MIDFHLGKQKFFLKKGYITEIRKVMSQPWKQDVPGGQTDEQSWIDRTGNPAEPGSKNVWQYVILLKCGLQTAQNPRKTRKSNVMSSITD